jgi:hypothetical protein
MHSYEAKINKKNQITRLNSSFNASEVYFVQNLSRKIFIWKCYLKNLVIEIMKSFSVSFHKVMSSNVAKR